MHEDLEDALPDSPCSLSRQSGVMEIAESSCQETSPLLDLPSEIRNRVYELILKQKGPVKIVDGQSPSDIWALLVTCRQIRGEASGFFYNGNIFGHHCAGYQSTPAESSVANLASWLKRIGPRNRAVVREIHVWRPKSKDVTMEDKRGFLEAHCAMLARCGIWLDNTVVRIREEAQHVSLSDLIVLTEPNERIENDYATGPDDFKGPSIRRWEWASAAFLEQERAQDEREILHLLSPTCSCPVPSDISAHREIVDVVYDGPGVKSHSLDDGGDVSEMHDISDILHRLFGSDADRYSDDETFEEDGSGELKDVSATGDELGSSDGVDVLDNFDFDAFMNASFCDSGLGNDVANEQHEKEERLPTTRKSSILDEA